MYKSPIEIIYGQMQTQIEGDILKAVQSFYPNVDKEELLLALQAVEHGGWKKYRDHFTDRHIGWICTNCSAVSHDLSNGDTPFCPHCGAMMDMDFDEED